MGIADLEEKLAKLTMGCESNEGIFTNCKIESFNVYY